MRRWGDEGVEDDEEESSTRPLSEVVEAATLPMLKKKKTLKILR